MNLPERLNRLVEELAKLPGVGRKSARRLGFALLVTPLEEAQSLAQAILEARQKIGICPTCFGLAEDQDCKICQDASREQGVICVVEDPRNIFTIEASGVYHGLYHVLGGTISPLKGISPEKLHIQALEARVKTQGTQELILATNPTLEGEATAHYLTDLFGQRGIKITRIARGMPSGSDLEFADHHTLARAFEGRTLF